MRRQLWFSKLIRVQKVVSSGLSCTYFYVVRIAPHRALRLLEVRPEMSSECGLWKSAYYFYARRRMHAYTPDPRTSCQIFEDSHPLVNSHMGVHVVNWV